MGALPENTMNVFNSGLSSNAFLQGEVTVKRYRRIVNQLLATYSESMYLDTVTKVHAI